MLRDAGDYFEVSQASPPSPAVVARLAKSSGLLSILVDGQTVVQESAPLSWDDTSSWQTLARDTAPLPPGVDREYFFGGGMQNGRFSHRDETIIIATGYDWDDGGHPNPVPWYVSSAGYGVLRNTWQPGTYSFASPVLTSHNESTRLDAFILLAGAGPQSLKTLLGLYTALTGPPFLPPLYGLFLGDSDCYHNDRHGNSTLVATAVAELYEQHDMPRGWMLTNDGYGCGYGEGPVPFPSNLTDLTLVIVRLHALGLFSGLWTSTGMPHIENEVGMAGSRICKTDVGWIGAGYKYAFDGVTLCADGIEKFSSPPARRFVWTVEGWAGTHRLAVMWTGDNSGSMDYVRWQLPTFIGAGFSAQAHVSGDVDGIFGGELTTRAARRRRGARSQAPSLFPPAPSTSPIRPPARPPAAAGSPESYVRDLQFKALTTTVMTMSGWAANPDKQPWTYGEPYTTINRASLKLKSRLTPYVYTASREAYDTGVPPVRAPLLEFPADGALYAASNATSYAFMSGASLLVAPVYEEGAVTRDAIYLPNGSLWVDWWDGSRYAGGQTLDGYAAPLDKLPLFVRAGAIIPLWPEMNFFNASAADPMFLELWPAGESEYSLYEDDGVTRAALAPSGPAFARTAIHVSAPASYLNGSASAGNVTVSVAPAAGAFAGQLTARGWWLDVRCLDAPLLVLLAVGGGAAAPLAQAQSEAELEYLASGWFHDASLQRGLLMVKLPSVPAAAGFEVTLSNGPSWPHIGTEACDTPAHRQVENQKIAFNETTGRLTVVPPPASAAGDAAAALCLTVGADKDPESHTPALEVQPCAAALDDQQRFAVVAASKQLALRSDPTTCLDQDVSDSRVIAYGCHDPGSPGNQAWLINPDGSSQHIVSGENGLCMCVLPPA